MLMLISPAKSLDFESRSPVERYSLPEFHEDAKKLISVLKNYSEEELSALMNISPSLAALNRRRFMEWQANPPGTLGKQALPAFVGEVFRGIGSADFNQGDFDFAQDHLRILSGLYGVLKPLDLIQAYRLEMGTRLNVGEFNTLYQFWGDRINRNINAQIGEGEVIVNLASNEYFKSTKPRKLNARVITPVFKDYNKGTLKVVTVYAKNSRGQMVRYIIKNRIDNPEKMKLFDVNGYEYHDGLSDENTWVFVRG